MYKALGLDIDGTLLNTKKEITPEVYNAISELQERNIPVFIVSGRPAQGIRHVESALNMKEKGGYILSFNGGKIIDCSNDEVIYSKTIPEDLYKEVYEYTSKMTGTMLTYRGDEIITENVDDKYIKIESSVVKMPVVKVDNLLNELTFPVDKFLIVGEPKHMEKQVGGMIERFRGRLNIFQSEPCFIEVVPMGIDKGTSLGILLERLGIKREELVVCGDAKNDITMIKYAGVGVAMENACEEAKAVADYITDSCDNDGVAKAIYKYFR